MALSISTLQSEAIDNYGSKDAFNGLARYDGVVWFAAQAGVIKEEVGGQPDFRERLMYGPNTTIAFRAKGGSISRTDDEGFTLVSVPQRTISGRIIWDQVEEDQVRGNWALAKSKIADKTKQFSTSWPVTIAEKIRQASPGANDPYTLLGASGEGSAILIPQAPASQTATTGGIPRSETVVVGGQTIRYWANQYSNTSMDLTSAAGRADLLELVYLPCVRGNGSGWAPDFGIVGTTAWASLSATADALRRGQLVNDKAVSFGFKNILFEEATLFMDKSTRFLNGTAGKVAFFNSKALKLKYLQGSGGVTKEMLDEENNLKSLPIFWKVKGLDDFDTLAKTWIGYLTMNWVPLSLQDHGLADNCT